MRSLDITGRYLVITFCTFLDSALYGVEKVATLLDCFYLLFLYFFSMASLSTKIMSRHFVSNTEGPVNDRLRVSPIFKSRGHMNGLTFKVGISTA